jgi:hypothetical protein
VPFYLSFFYPRDKVGFRHGMSVLSLVVASSLGTLVLKSLLQSSATDTYQLHCRRSSSQRIRRCPRIRLVPYKRKHSTLEIFSWFFLPDSLAKCKFLSDREKQIAAAAVSRDQHADPDRAVGFQFSEMLKAFKEPKGKRPPLPQSQTHH